MRGLDYYYYYYYYYCCCYYYYYREHVSPLRDSPEVLPNVSRAGGGEKRERERESVARSHKSRLTLG
jgi:hypothetical protein